jgi:DNA repair exonuclease SbcCD nuclease subunit
MSLILMYSDLHLRDERKDDCALVLDKVIDTAQRIQDKTKREVTILNGGDTFNTRGLIRTSCWDLFYQKCEQMHSKGFKKIIIVGNHDQEDKAGDTHPMRVFTKWKGWSVVDKPMELPDYPKSIFFPYMSVSAIEAFFDSDESGSKWKGFDAFVHWGVRGAKRNDSNVDADGVPIEWLKRFRAVYSGHYHYRSVYKNLQYIGSPMQQNFGEMGQDKGLLLLDQKSGKSSFLEIKGLPKHREIEVVDGKISEHDKFSDEDFLRVIVKGDVETTSKVTHGWVAERFKARDVKIERLVSEKHFSRMSLKSEDILNQSQIMNKYVDFVSTKLDKKKLLTVGQDFI